MSADRLVIKTRRLHRDAVGHSGPYSGSYSGSFVIRGNWCLKSLALAHLCFFCAAISADSLCLQVYGHAPRFFFFASF